MSLFLGCLTHLLSLQTQEHETSRSASCCGCQEAAQPKEAVTESEGCQREQVILDGEGLRAGICAVMPTPNLPQGEPARMDVQVSL